MAAFKHFLPVCVCISLSRGLASSTSRIFEMSQKFTKKVYSNTVAIFWYMQGKAIITLYSNLILQKMQVKYSKIWILKKGTFIQRHLRTL